MCCQHPLINYLGSRNWLVHELLSWTKIWKQNSVIWKVCNLLWQRFGTKKGLSSSKKCQIGGYFDLAIRQGLQLVSAYESQKWTYCYGLFIPSSHFYTNQQNFKSIKRPAIKASKNIFQFFLHVSKTPLFFSILIVLMKV